MDVNKLVEKMTFEEKTEILTGTGNMSTLGIERLGVEAKKFADGPHGVRNDDENSNCTAFPNLCSLAATWNTDMARLYGNALADDCIEYDVDMILAPGINIKKNILCGRNFEYISEDPVLAGEMGAEYINGVQENGVGTSLKHFAANNQERTRGEVSSEVDERTLREIYLKGFEIAIKKSNPTSVMCAYNKVNSIWCSENKMLLNDILRDEWGYEGFVVSDWGAVQDINKAVPAGLDLQMPKNDDIQEQIKFGLENGKITEEDIDKAVKRMLKFASIPKAQKKPYDRAKQHEIAQRIAADGIVMMKNNNDVLPLNKYKKIAVIGEFAKNALISGQGSAEVHVQPQWIDSPIEELKKALPDTEVSYWEIYKKGEFSSVMLWPLFGEFDKFVEEADVVVAFAGSMESEDTEFNDRRSAELNPNYTMFIEHAKEIGKKVVVVLQSGGVMFTEPWDKSADGIVEMWLGGEGAGKAIAGVLSGKVNPSGKLPETFPKTMRKDIEYPGDGLKVEYNEKMDVGYRYYDKHTEEISYPFGHGLSYTSFEYENCRAELMNDVISVKVDVKNTGDCDGAEVVQVYVNDPISTMKRPEKELKAFKKVFVKSGETETVELTIPVSYLAYYNIMLRKWVTEPGVYNILIGSSSRDIRAKKSISYDEDCGYTMKRVSADMIG